MQNVLHDVFGKEYSLGDIFAYAKHGGYMCIYRVKKINARTLSCHPIKECADGYWRERTDVRTSAIQWPRMGMIINDQVGFPFTEVPEPTPKVKRQSFSNHSHDDEDDD